MSKRHRKPTQPIQGGGDAETILFSIRAWCRREIPPDAPVFAIRGKLRAGVNLVPEGHFIRIELTTPPGKVVHGAVVSSDSDAKREGWDLAFPACSQECADELMEALHKTAHAGTVLGLPGPA